VEFYLKSKRQRKVLTLPPMPISAFEIVTGSGWINGLFTLNVKPWLVNLESTFPAVTIM